MLTPPTVAVIGGGQLARMMQESAVALGINLRALVEASDGSTGQVTVDKAAGDPADLDAVRTLIDGADVLTFEHEHQDSALLERLQAEGVSVQPTPQALTLARDKLAMRRMMSEAGPPAGPSVPSPATTARTAASSSAAPTGASGVTWPVDPSAASTRALRRMPRALASSCIMRASCPPPITATMGALTPQGYPHVAHPHRARVQTVGWGP